MEINALDLDTHVNCQASHLETNILITEGWNMSQICQEHISL